MEWRRGRCSPWISGPVQPRPSSRRPTCSRPWAARRARYCGPATISVVYGSAAEVAELDPDLAALAKVDCWAAIATAPGEDGIDFVSRFFAPAHTIAYAEEVGQAHMRVRLKSADGAAVGGIAFRAAGQKLGAALLESRGGLVHAAGSLAIDRWQGEERVQLRLAVIAPAEPIAGSRA